LILAAIDGGQPRFRGWHSLENINAQHRNIALPAAVAAPYNGCSGRALAIVAGDQRATD
jgi:hypothetical protein